MRWLLLIAALLPAGASAAPRKAEAPAHAAPVVAVEVVRQANDWTAEFTFGRDAPVWAFTRSAMTREGTQPWRPLAWTVETKGVELQRLGFYDALVATKGTVPRKVRIRFKPYANGLRADYDPALAFTDGSVALYTEHYNAVPLPSQHAARSLPSHLNGLDLPHDEPAAVTFTDRGATVLHAGRRSRSVTVSGADSYVLFGSARTVEAPAITTIMDPQLPLWLTAELADYTPKLLSFYAERLGPRQGPKPMIMVTWAGPTPGVRSMGGSVLPGLITMRFEGQVVAARSKAVQDAARWFIAHESSHFWAGQAVSYGSPAEAWITEGGADLLAIRAAAQLDTSFDSRAELQKRLDDCVSLAAKGPISTAAERNEHNVYYSCGAMFGLAAEAAAAKKGGDFFGFWKGLIERNRADGIADRRDWLAELSGLTGSNNAGSVIERMLDNASPNAAEMLAELFRSTGVAVRRDATGRLLLS